jgi:hypothetical protein
VDRLCFRELPSSQHYHISKIMDLVTIVDPRSVLDVGTGFGKYGILCREYLELWDGRQKYSDFKRRIDGVEAFSPYITPLHNYVYDNLYVEDVRELVDKLDYNYDLVLLIDVLEHFSKTDGELLLEKLLSKNLGILISTPKDPSDQKNAFGNIYETHKSRWTIKDISKLIDNKKYDSRDINITAKSDNGYSGNRCCYFVRDPVSIIGYVGSVELVHKLKRKRFIRRLNRVPYMETSLRFFVRRIRPQGKLLLIFLVACSILFH